MSVVENERITQETFAAWNAHDPELYTAHVADDYVWESDWLPNPVRGPQEVKVAMQAYFTAFPDLRLDVETTIASDNVVAKTWTATGTHKGEFLGVPATNKHVSARGCTVVELEDGKVIKSTTYSDRMTLLKQLGVLKSVAAS
jgi:steroid delta-isomerase-like uncharacterized protein